MSKAKIELSIHGMHCIGCATTVTEAIKKKGGEDVYVDFTTSLASFNLSKSEKLEDIVNAVLLLGYKVNSQGGQREALSLNVKFIISLIFTAPLLLHMFLENQLLHNPFVQLFLCTPVYIIGFLHYGKSGLGSLKAGSPNMDVLIFIGSSAAFFYSFAGTILNLGPNYLFYETAASIITLVLLGNILEHSATKQTTKALEELGRIKPEKAKKLSILGGKEIITEIPSTEVSRGDILVINQGDKIPSDGIIRIGSGTINESMITGESLPIEKNQDDKVIGGTILIVGNIQIEATEVGEDSVLSGIIRLVKHAQTSKPSIHRLADRISAVFVPIVISLSLLTLLISYFFLDTSFQEGMFRAIAVLVISCPCAMGLATPAAVMVGIGRAAKNGILIKEGKVLEELPRTKFIFFDKTGTITTGKFSIKDLEFNGISEAEGKGVIVALERVSSHPIAKSLLECFKSASPLSLTEIRETKGVGVVGSDKDGNVYEITGKANISPDNSLSRKDIYLLKNKKIVASINIQDEIKSSASQLISDLKRINIQPIFLSGDTYDKTSLVSKTLEVDIFFAQKLPAEKLKIIEEYTQKGKTVMVGDGINDAAALSRANVGISLGDATGVAIESAQIVLLNNNLASITQAINISTLTLSTIKQNLFWAFFYNILAIPIAASGYLSPIVGAGAMAFSDLIVIGNSLRLRNRKI